MSDPIEAKPVGPPIEDPAMLRRPDLPDGAPPPPWGAIAAFEGGMLAPPMRLDTSLTVTELATKLLAAWTVGKPENADEWMASHAVDLVKRMRMLASGGT